MDMTSMAEHSARPSLNIDFETRSTVDLRKTGVYPYAESPTTDIWCMAWAIGEMEPEIWTPPNLYPPEVVEELGLSHVIPHELREHVRSGGEIRAWNAQFERVIWWLILTPRYDFPRPSLEQFVDTAAEAAAMALPRSLKKAGAVLGVDEQKDDAGHRLMMQMARPRRPRTSQGEDPDGTYWWDRNVEKIGGLLDYCKQDVRTERDIGRHLRPLNSVERRVYLLDQKMNDRGVKFDQELIEAAQKIVEEGERRANLELEELTGGKVDAVTNTGAMRDFLAVDSVAKDMVRDMLDDDELDEIERRVLEIRQDAGKSSTAKLTSMQKYACSDYRARGMLTYHGAGTGRWSGRGPQPQNYPRPELSEQEIQRAILHLKEVGARSPGKVYDRIEAELGPPLHVVSSCLRAMLVADDGRRFIGGDYSQIEARVLAWIAEQEDLVQLFAADGKVYEDMASTIYGIPVDEIAKDSVERQIGKNTVLGCGFQMGPDTFWKQVKQQTGIDLSTEHELEEMEEGWRCSECGESWKRKPTSRCIAEAIRAVNAYRNKNDKIKAFWYAINDAAIEAVANPGKVVHVGRNGLLRYVVKGPYLWAILPSGRTLAYAHPRLVKHTVKPKRGEPFTTTAVAFMAMNGYTRRWQKHHGYGGLWTENVVQAMARDLIAAALLRLEKADYRPILSVHDEVLSEPELGHGSVDEYLDLMKVPPRWAEGLPIGAEGWEGERYRK